MTNVTSQKFLSIGNNIKKLYYIDKKDGTNDIQLPNSERLFLSSLAGQLVRHKTSSQIIFKDNTLWGFRRSIIKNFPNILVIQVNSVENLLKMLRNDGISIEGYIVLTEDKVLKELMNTVNYISGQDMFTVIVSKEMENIFGGNSKNIRDNFIGSNIVFTKKDLKEMKSNGNYNKNMIIHQNPAVLAGGNLVSLAISYSAFVYFVKGFKNFLFPKFPVQLNKGFMVFGWAGNINGIPMESVWVANITKRGGVIVPSDGLTNLALYTGLRNFNKLLKPKTIKKVKYDPSEKVTIAFLNSDGDNLTFMAWLNSATTDAHDFPMSFTVSTMAAEVCPLMLQNIYQNAFDTDSFVAGPSGNGYQFPNLIAKRSEYLKSYQDGTQESLKKSGISIVNQINISWSGLFSGIRWYICGTTRFCGSCINCCSNCEKNDCCEECATCCIGSCITCSKNRIPKDTVSVDVENKIPIISMNYFSYSIGFGAHKDNIFTCKYQLMLDKDVESLYKDVPKMKKGDSIIISTEGWRFKVWRLRSIVSKMRELNPDIEFVTVDQLIEQTMKEETGVIND
jgi:hypothetical protein